MNRLDAALEHFHAALKELGVKQPVSRLKIWWRLRIELMKQAASYLSIRKVVPNVR